MAAPKRAKASEKQSICKKLVSLLKKRYKGSALPEDRPVLETMLYAICLEDASVEDAETAYQRHSAEFYDLNEIRVSSIAELESLFDGMSQAEWKALRFRALLNEVFEQYYAFDFELLRRKTLELAQKELSRFKYLSPFVRLYTLQTIMGAHLVPLDASLLRAAVWLGLVDPSGTIEEGSEQLKAAVRKADVAPFCHYLRCLATDPDVDREFDPAKTPIPEGGFDAFTAIDRLTEALERCDAAAREKRLAKKASARKAGGSGTASLEKSGAKRTTAKRRTKEP